ncbi:MAG: DUF4282 domain-containing protein [Phycisphaeraceae bacterium]|nr:DUF4282 domain-containing protein [Phycisphaeraceae bacterium]
MDQQQAKPDGGLTALLDFGFTKFVTLGVVKFVYILGMLLIALAFLGFLISSFSMGTMAVIGALIIGPIAAVLYLLFFRISLELIVILFRIEGNTSKLVEGQNGRGTPPS